MTVQNPRRFDRSGTIACFAFIGAFSALTGWTPAVAQQDNSASILIYDASGSMWGQLDGGISKVEIAREVIGDFFVSRDNTIPLGVIAYGHNRRGDCSDIEVVADVGISDPRALSTRLNRLNPRGMTPITDSLALAASMIPPTAESADIILVTDGLETCEADPCALAAQLANEGIAIRAHVVGFGLTREEGEVMACVTDATGGLLLTPQTGQELADALRQVAQVEPAPAVEPAPEPVVEAFFDIGPKAEAGYTYRIGYQGSARNVDYAGFTRRGENQPDVSQSYGVIGGGDVGNNPFTKRAPLEPGEYDLILSVAGQGIIARQPIEVVPPSSGFDVIGSVEPGSRFAFTWRGPNQISERIVIAQPGASPEQYDGDWGYPMSNAATQTMRLTAPTNPGIYELRYLSANGKEILFSRTFGVGVPYEDADQTSSSQLAAQAAAATQAAPGQDAMPMVRATFRIPDNYPQIPLWWDAIPLDPDMMQEAYAPISDLAVWDNEFEPGRYRVSATGPGETEFSAIVEIYPGQDNNFIIPVVGGGDEEAAATSLSGPWQVIGVPPYQVQAGADQLLVLTLDQSGPGAPVSGGWVAGEMLAGPQVAGRKGHFTESRIEDDALRLTFDVGAPIPEPMTLFLRPYGIGYAGSLSSGALGMSVLMWPDGYEPPSLAEMREAVHGPAPSDFVDLSAAANTGGDLAAVDADPAAFKCTQSQGCAFSHQASGISVVLPNAWALSEPFFYETAGGARSDLPSASFFSDEAGQRQTIELNPRQWLASNGPCRIIGANALCMMRDQGPLSEAAFAVLGDSLTIGGTGALAAASPDSVGDAIHIRTTSTSQFGSACFVKFELDNPSGETFTAYAPLSATSNGQPVSQVISNEPLVMEIITTGNYGAGIVSAMLGAACEQLSLDIGPVQCRMGAPPSGAMVDCPSPIEIAADPLLARIRLVSEAQTASVSAPASSTFDEDIPIDLGDRSPEDVMQWLFSKP